GKENRLQILQSIDQGSFELGTTRDTLGNTSEGGVILGPERPRTYDDLDDNEKKRYDADVRATNIVLQGLPKDIYKLINHNIEANPQAGPSNASILSEVHILENAIDHSVSNQDEHEIHNKVQPSNVIDSTSVHMGNSNVIPYEQYLSVNDTSVVPSYASSALNSVCVSPVNDALVPHDPIATELKIYKEHVAIYEQRAKFELIECEQ
ncbi:hypothetical protein Tco_1480438, partial [Tanacetum coccineum]